MKKNIKLPNTGLKNPIQDDLSHSWHLFVIQTKYRDQLMGHLKNRGIQTSIHYPIPPHKQQALREFKFEAKFPVTELIHNQVVSLPIGPDLSEENVLMIANEITKTEI